MNDNSRSEKYVEFQVLYLDSFTLVLFKSLPKRCYFDITRNLKQHLFDPDKLRNEKSRIAK